MNLEKGDQVMDVARVVNEDEEPKPIASGEEGEVQEVVDSAALEDALGIDDDGADEDGLDDDDLPSIEELVDEIDGDDDDGPPSDSIDDLYRGETED